jgi:hypothetical protein
VEDFFRCHCFLDYREGFVPLSKGSCGVLSLTEAISSRDAQYSTSKGFEVSEASVKFYLNDN